METAPALDGAALRRARERAGLSQSGLARAAGVADGQRISRWERGEARPRSAAALRQVAVLLHVSPRSLLLPPTGPPSLRWLRYAAGTTVEELAAAIHASPGTVKRWEASGLLKPADSTVSAVAAALGASADDVREALRQGADSSSD